MPTSILIATANAAKVREFQRMLASDRLQWRSLSDFGPAQSIEETGQTFRDNACLKAEGYARQFNTWALADDSGLEVDALDGNPGVYSARWAAMNGTGRGDADNNATLLRQLEAIEDPHRTARFVCVLALADPTGRIVLTTSDAVEGRLLREPRGSNGFGYDPLFMIDSLGRTTAELAPEAKHQISHRGKALRQMAQAMKDIQIA